MHVRQRTGGRLLTGLVSAAVVCGLPWGQPAVGQQPATAGAPAAVQPIDTKANELNYNRETGWMIAKGDVIITKGDTELRANYVRVNVRTEDAHAYGDVVLTEGDQVWKGRSLDYNFGTKTGAATGVSGVAEPFRIIRNDKIERLSDNTFLLHNAVITTCSNEFENCHFHVRAREVSIVPDDYLQVRGGLWYFAGIPTMYLPYWKKDLREDFGWEFRPGHSSRMGTYLLSAYRYRINPSFTGRSHLDYRTMRGFAVGQDIGWSWPTRGTGDLALYYADDDKPIDDDEDAASSDIESERYRVRLKHYVGLSFRDYAIARMDYLSDTDILEDFFEREYRQSPVPENEVSYAHRGDQYTAGLLVRGRLNDFFSGVNRLPEASLDFMRSELGESSFYYEGRTEAAYLEQVFAEASDDEDYSTFRLDSQNMFYRPSRHFGFLTVVPRAGVRGTFFSQTREIETLTEVLTVTQTNTVTDATGGQTTVVSTGTETNTTTRNLDAGSGFRSLFEVGLESSFKAFRTWDGGGRHEPRRHIVEPYANYTYRSEPTILPDELYQFDAIDAIIEANEVKFGVRNKLQVRREGRPFDLVDVDLYTRYRFYRDPGERSLDNYFLDAELRPSDWFKVDLDGVIDSEDNTINAFNTQIILTPESGWRAAAEHRFVADRSSLLIGSLTLMPNEIWHFNLNSRYELEDSRLQEQGGYVQRNFDCMTFRLIGRILPSYTRPDGSEHDTDYRVSLEFWLTAFPEFGVLRRNRS